MWDLVLVGVIVLAAAAYVGRRMFKAAKRPESSCGCESPGCPGCGPGCDCGDHPAGGGGR